MHLFTADAWTGNMIPCDEGELEWVDKKDVPRLPLWEGDLLFFRLIEAPGPFFSLKLVYQGDALVEAVLNGKRLR